MITRRVILVTSARYEVSELVRAFEAAVSRIGSPHVVLQLRDKQRGERDLEPIARVLRAVSSSHAVPFVVGDHPKLAVSVGADGVHVPGGTEAIRAARRIVPAEVRVSAPCHSDDDAAALVGAGANALFVSPIYETPGKGEARGVAALREAAERLGLGLRPSRGSVALVALGGVTAAPGGPAGS